jgi:hypothetical protein
MQDVSRETHGDKMQHFRDRIEAMRRRAQREYWMDLAVIVVSGLMVCGATCVGLGFALLRMGVLL